MRETLLEDKETDTVALASGALVETCLACLYSNQKKEKAATVC